MIKKILIFAAISSSTMMYSNVMADIFDSGRIDPGLYLSAGIGTGLENDIEGSIGANDITTTGRITLSNEIGIGYDLGNSWRVEVGIKLNTSEVENVTVDGTEYDVDVNGAGTSVQFAVAYDFENNSKITPYLGVSNMINWSDDVDGISTSYGIDFGVSSPLSNFLDFWGAVDLSLSPYQTNKQVSYDGAIAWGFSTGLRFRL